jgi:outer membrane immunogenic protein
MSITRSHHYCCALVSLILGFGHTAQTHASTNFDSFFADFGFGYREVNSGTSSSLSVNGTPIPSTLSSGQPANIVSVFTLGYNLPIDSAFKLGIGANISPASGQAQQIQVGAQNQVVSLQGISHSTTMGSSSPQALSLEMVWLISRWAPRLRSIIQIRALTLMATY